MLQDRDSLATVQQVRRHLARLRPQGDRTAGLVDKSVGGHQANDDRRVAERIGHQIAEVRTGPAPRSTARLVTIAVRERR